jgi:hypothetical protein
VSETFEVTLPGVQRQLVEALLETAIVDVWRRGERPTRP